MIIEYFRRTDNHKNNLVKDVPYAQATFKNERVMHILQKD